MSIMSNTFIVLNDDGTYNAWMFGAGFFFLEEAESTPDDDVKWCKRLHKELQKLVPDSANISLEEVNRIGAATTCRAGNKGADNYHALAGDCVFLFNPKTRNLQYFNSKTKEFVTAQFQAWTKK